MKAHWHFCPDCKRSYNCYTVDCPYENQARCHYCFHGLAYSLDNAAMHPQRRGIIKGPLKAAE